MSKLEEAAKEYSEDATSSPQIDDAMYRGFIDGAAWQAEQAKVLEDALQDISSQFNGQVCDWAVKALLKYYESKGGGL